MHHRDVRLIEHGLDPREHYDITKLLFKAVTGATGYLPDTEFKRAHTAARKIWNANREDR